ncbi:MAG: formylglycine-generating enzyme family protein [Pirellulales bacterium]
MKENHLSWLWTARTGQAAAAGVAVVILAAGIWSSSLPWTGVGGALMIAWCLGFTSARAKIRFWKRPAPSDSGKPPAVSKPKPIHARRANGKGSDGLIDVMLSEGRYALLLRPQVIDNLSDQHLNQTVVELQEAMAIVPRGQVVLGKIDDALNDGRLDSDEIERHHGRVVDVEPVFIDRYPVTNLEYQQFVDNGGYDEMAIWDEEVLPAMLDFVDRSGHPGPRRWNDGRFKRGKENHPVVGICWYEAIAYARWVGKRLPTDAEWCKAGCWPVTISPGNWLQRMYPWGNAFERARANVWGSGLDRIVAGDQFPEGMSVGGVYQLIGNVWEWMSGPFGSAEDNSLALPMPMKSIRGGAFDSYFEKQMTCQFQSGESPISRKHNIGFRLALGACDLAPQAAELLLSGDARIDDATPVEEVSI